MNEPTDKQTDLCKLPSKYAYFLVENKKSKKQTNGQTDEGMDGQTIKLTDGQTK